MDYGCIVYFINKPNIHRISNDNQARCLVLPNDENIVVEKRGNGKVIAFNNYFHNRENIIIYVCAT